ARNGRNPGRNLRCGFEIDVSDGFSVRVLRDSDIDHNRSRFQMGSSDETRLSDGDEKKIGLLRDRGQVFRFAVAVEHRRVPLEEKLRQWFSDDVRSTDDAGDLSLNRIAVMIEKA